MSLKVFGSQGEIGFNTEYIVTKFKKKQKKLLCV